jgi:hypothetical protein
MVLLWVLFGVAPLFRVCAACCVLRAACCVLRAACCPAWVAVLLAPHGTLEIEKPPTLWTVRRHTPASGVCLLNNKYDG